MKRLIFTLLLLTALVTGTAWWLSRPTATEENWPHQELKRGTIVETVSATGTLQPREITRVTSEVAGRIVSIKPEAALNHEVRRGQPLIELDSQLARERLEQATLAVELARADLARAQAAVDAAQVVLDRAEELINKGTGFRRDVDVARAQLKVSEVGRQAAEVRIREAQAGQRLAQTGLEMLTLTAPADGLVISRGEGLALGQTVSPVSPAPLLLIADSLKTLEVVVQVAEGDISRARVGDRATFTVNPYPNEVFEGVVSERRPMPTSIQGAVYFPVVVRTDNLWDKELKSWKLLPGMPASVDIIRRTHTDVWLVPTPALHFQPDKRYLTEDAQREEDTGRGPDWRPIWTLGPQRKLVPLWARIGGTNAAGEEGLRDASFTEVLEWGTEVRLDPKAPGTWPKVITGPLPGGRAGPLDRGLKIF